MTTGHGVLSTRFLGPTNHLGSRVICTDGQRRVTVSWDYGLHVDANHDAAANAWLARYNPEGDLAIHARGTQSGGHGHVYLTQYIGNEGAK